MPAYTHETGEVTVTVPGSPLHRQMVAKAADPASGWSLGDRPADPASGWSLGDRPADPPDPPDDDDVPDVDVAGEP